MSFEREWKDGLFMPIGIAILLGMTLLSSHLASSTPMDWVTASMLTTVGVFAGLAVLGRYLERTSGSASESRGQEANREL